MGRRRQGLHTNLIRKAPALQCPSCDEEISAREVRTAAFVMTCEACRAQMVMKWPFDSALPTIADVLLHPPYGPELDLPITVDVEESAAASYRDGGQRKAHFSYVQKWRRPRAIEVAVCVCWNLGTWLMMAVMGIAIHPAAALPVLGHFVVGIWMFTTLPKMYRNTTTVRCDDDSFVLSTAPLGWREGNLVLPLEKLVAIEMRPQEKNGSAAVEFFYADDTSHLVRIPTLRSNAEVYFFHRALVAFVFDAD